MINDVPEAITDGLHHKSPLKYLQGSEIGYDKFDLTITR